MIMAQINQPQKGEVSNDLPKILVLGLPTVFRVYESQFSEKFYFLKPWESTLPLQQFLSTHAATIKVILCSAAASINAGVLQNLPKLQVILTTSAGVNHIDIAECHCRGISIAYAGTIFSEEVADVAVGLVIDVLRRISAANRLVNGGLWPQKGDYPLGSKLGGKRIGIVGLGSIGLHVAKRLEAFNCTISYNSTKKKPSVTFPFYAKVRELAVNSDILIICCALTDQTRHMIDKEVMLALGKEGIIVNIARGSIIDEKALVQCLVRGEIAGAGLDVYENEPAVPKELLVLDNVVLSPHCAAFTEEASRDQFELLCTNLDAFFSNKPLMNQFVGA